MILGTLYMETGKLDDGIRLLESQQQQTELSPEAQILLGRLYFEAIGRRDYDTVMGLTLVFSVLTLLGQLLADLLYAVVDPRVTYH